MNMMSRYAGTAARILKLIANIQIIQQNIIINGMVARTVWKNYGKARDRQQNIVIK